MRIHKTYTSLYEPIYLFSVPPKVFVWEALGLTFLFFFLSLLLSFYIEMIISIGITLILCLFIFFILHSLLAHKYQVKGFYWREEEKFFNKIPYKKIYKKGKAYLP